MKQTKNQGLEIEERRTKLKALHGDQKTVFLHPAFGPNTYAQVGEAITQDGLARPTMADTTDLVYAAFKSENSYSQEIKKLMRDRWLWGFTGNLYVPQEGVYVQDNPQIRKGMPFMEKSELVRKLEVQDPSVRFVPFGFPMGEMSPEDLATNTYVIALAGEEGAEKLGEVATKFRNKLYLYSFTSVDEPLTRVSALNSDWDDVHRLSVSGNIRGDVRDGCAFGVLDKTGEASRTTKSKEKTQ